MSSTRMALLACLFGAALAAQGDVTLAELPALARARADRQRPAQQKALDPFLHDLSLDYRRNQELLDRQIAAAAELGDGIVPLLLENMTPKEESEAARHLAANSARVLKLCDPSAFTEALVEIAGGKSETGRLWALWLLASSKSPAAAQAMMTLLPALRGKELVQCIDSLAALAHAPAAAIVMPHVQSGDKRLREAALGYLVAVKSAAGVDATLRALAVETDDALVPLYVAYLEATAADHAGAATALVPLVTGERLDKLQLDKEQLANVCRALATIAPKGHAPTIKALKSIVDRPEIGQLGCAAAITMRELGDKSGVKTLTDNLQRHVNERRKESLPLATRADAYLALGEPEKAIHDYKEAIKLTTSVTLASTLWIEIARCEARRERWPAVKQAFLDSRAPYDTLQKEIARRPELQKAMANDAVRKYVESLKR